MEALKKKEYTLRISQANRCGLVVIVYEICMDYLTEAREAYEAEDYDAYHNALYFARNCITQQMASLNMSRELSVTLMQIYLFCIRELAKAEGLYRVEGVDRVYSIMEKLRDAFHEIEKEDDSEAVMGHAQDVYAGLTYGAGGLNEDIVSAANRGFQA